MSEENYSKRELDHKFNDVHEKLDKILQQTTKHNGRMSKMEKILLAVGCVTVTLLVVNGSEFVSFLNQLVL